MIIREATVDDVPAILPMVDGIIRFHAQIDPDRYASLPDAHEMYRGWLRSRATDPRSVLLVAEPGGDGGSTRLAGFLVGGVEREVPIYKLGEFGIIHDLWVESDYRNEGIGRQMVTLAVERFTRLGLRQVRLHVASANSVAQNLFGRCQFRAASVEMLLNLEAP